MKPLVESLQVEVPPGSRADAEKIIEFLEDRGFADVSIPLRVLRTLPALLRESLTLNAVLVRSREGWRLAEVAGNKPLAVALDLGSTNIAACLINPASGAVLAERQTENPQTSFSEDILDRILHSGARMDELHPPLIYAINELVEGLCRDTGKDLRDVLLLAVSGNTAMTHLFLGLEATNLPTVPNNPVIHSPGFMDAASIGIDIHPEAQVYMLPNVGAFVGGDVVADLLHSGFGRSDETNILVDVGTNVEIAIGNREWILVAAGAAGPALEGGIVSHGGRAASGAVERIRIDRKSGALLYKTVNGSKPDRICGSGLIDLVAELFMNGWIDGRGRFVQDKAPLCGELDGHPAICVVSAEETITGKPLLLSEKDLKNLITSKAGMYALIKTLTSHVGISVDDIDRFFVCGSFGNYIDPEKAVSIGMLPRIPLEKFVPLGNASLKGAMDIILDRSSLDQLKDLTARTTYIDMNTDPMFMRELPGALFIPHTDADRFE